MRVIENAILIDKAENYISNMYSRPKGKKRGACCEFYPLTETVGIKAYRKYGDADDTRHMQTIFARYGCAPQVLSEIHRTECPDSRCEYIWYLTEIAKPLNEFCSDSDISRNQKGMRECCAKMRKLGANLWGDLHEGNYGILPNGRVVCIDFSWYRLEPKNKREETSYVNGTYTYRIGERLLNVEQVSSRKWEAWYADNHAVIYQARSRAEVLADAWSDTDSEICQLVSTKNI